MLDARRQSTTRPAGSARSSGPRSASRLSSSSWAVAFTDNLNKVTTASLNWVTGTFGWTYLVVTLGILIFLVFLAFSPFGDLRLGKDTDRPEFNDRHLAGDDPERGDGHRPGVLRCGGTDLASRDATARAGRAQHARGRGARPAVLLLRLGPARLGDLRRLRPGHRVLDVPQGPPHAGQPAVRAAARRPSQRSDR